MIQQSFQFPGSNNRPITADLTINPAKGDNQPVIVYAHGFNGFKDWGNGALIANRFADAGFAFFKFNFSHNGTTPEHLQDFADLEAFGHNNYSLQLADLSIVFDWLEDDRHGLAGLLDTSRIGLIGHSMGGGISIIKTAEDSRIKALCTWAAIAECKTPWTNWPQEKLALWQQTGVQYYTNGRTKQEMPLYYQLYEDYQQHSKRLNILAAAARIKVPVLVCHGTEDTSVPVSSAYAIHEAQPDSELYLLPSDHVFGRRHPWTEPVLPPAMQQVLDKAIVFFRHNLD
ncbi:alpha/beta hydrolase family protein [Taibaiella chishuiensis]|uniref:Dienelactone hydrolase family protein n=1 Tax=Taibaiella chishuiensis TaxID=1434707 RepID=A0A2P8DCE6_9BACT|nr:dienelactone hydrolase family protein [Taibaiella chishuiensis]PSK94893.1 dienelactone hydrolase family protein [Taibaiella chishuiensis]